MPRMILVDNRNPDGLETELPIAMPPRESGRDMAIYSNGRKVPCGKQTHAPCEHVARAIADFAREHDTHKFA